MEHSAKNSNKYFSRLKAKLILRNFKFGCACPKGEKYFIVGQKFCLYVIEFFRICETASLLKFPNIFVNRNKEVLNEFYPTLIHDFYFCTCTTNVILPFDMSGTLVPVLLERQFLDCLTACFGGFRVQGCFQLYRCLVVHLRNPLEFEKQFGPLYLFGTFGFGISSPVPARKLQTECLLRLLRVFHTEP